MSCMKSITRKELFDNANNYDNINTPFTKSIQADNIIFTFFFIHKNIIILKYPNQKVFGKYNRIYI